MAKNTRKKKPPESGYYSIPYNPTGGPVILEVLPGYATLGEFLLAYRPVDVYDYKEWGKDPKRVDDNINDLFVIPFPLAELDKYVNMVIGKYAPAPGHDQVKIDYVYMQDGEELLKVTLQEPVASGFKSFTHKFKFKKK